MTPPVALTIVLILILIAICGLAAYFAFRPGKLESLRRRRTTDADKDNKDAKDTTTAAEQSADEASEPAEDEKPLDAEELDDCLAALTARFAGGGAAQNIIPTASADFSINPSAQVQAQLLGLTEADLRKMATAHPATHTGRKLLLFTDKYTLTFNDDGTQLHHVESSDIPREQPSTERHRPKPRAGSRIRNDKQAQSRTPAVQRLPYPQSVNDMKKRLHEFGFSVTQTKKHFKAHHPDFPGRCFTFSCTPSDVRSYRNMTHELRQQFGIDLRQPSHNMCDQAKAAS